MHGERYWLDRSFLSFTVNWQHKRHIPHLKVIQIQKDIRDVSVALSSGLSPVSTVPPGTKDPVLEGVTDEKLTSCGKWAVILLLGDLDPLVKAERAGSRSAATEDW